MTATATYAPVYEVINELKAATSKKEKNNLLQRLFAVANEAEMDFRALDKEAKKAERMTAELKGQINNLNVLLSM